MLEKVYMVALEGKDKAGIRWYCTNRGSKPFVTFNLPSAKREVTKLKNLGYRAGVVTVNAQDSTCFLDLKSF